MVGSIENFSYSDYVAVYAAFVATLTASWTIFQNAREIGAVKVSMMIGHIIPLPNEFDPIEYGDSPLLIIVTAVNTGKFPVTITGLFIRYYESDRAKDFGTFKRLMAWLTGNGSAMLTCFALPRKIEHGDSVSAYHPRFELISQNIRSLFLTDSTGKRHKVSKKDLAKAIKHYSAEVGQSRIRFWYTPFQQSTQRAPAGRNR